MRRIRRGNEGSIAISMIVIFVATALVAMVLVLAQSGMRASRRAGDSANALQIADAGVNHAVKELTNYTGPLSSVAPAGYSGPLPIMPVIERTLGGGSDKYKVYAAKLDPSDPASIWHITAYGTDSNGVTRKIEADAKPIPLFGHAVFGASSIRFGSGIKVDSFKSGENQAATCNRKGFVGSDKPEDVDVDDVQGSGNGVRNCTGQTAYPAPRPNGGDGWVYDGCIGYADTEPVPAFQNEPQNDSCGEIVKDTPTLAKRFEDVTFPAGVTQDYTCDGPEDALPPGIHYRQNVVIKNGCQPIPLDTTCLTPPAAWTAGCLGSTSAASGWNPVRLVVIGTLKIGENQKGNINEPPNTCPLTAASGKDYYAGNTQADLNDYCRGWAGAFQIWAAGTGTVQLEKPWFWGVIYAPKRQITGGGPDVVVFGAITGSSVNGGVQMTVHYDEILSQLTSGTYVPTNWHESAQE